MDHSLVVEINLAAEIERRKPGLSIVIIGRNEGKRLELCLRSVLEMDKPADPLEVIYVDSASIDGSIEFARSFGADVVEITSERPTAALARNVGWRRASAPFVLFLDGDTILYKEFVARALPELREESVAVVWGHRREVNPAASIYNRVLDLDWIYRPGVSNFCGGDALVRRSALEETGGFDESLIAGEEPELCQRLRDRNYEILHIDAPMTAHDLGVTKCSQYWTRAVRAGYAYAAVSARLRAKGLRFWGDEVRRNRNRALCLTVVPVVALVSFVAMRSPLPLAFLPLLFILVVCRTSWAARWKSANLVTLLLYGLHSHVQQLPIFFGQLKYARDRMTGQRRSLMEYKQIQR